MASPGATIETEIGRENKNAAAETLTEDIHSRASVKFFSNGGIGLRTAANTGGFVYVGSGIVRDEVKEYKPSPTFRTLWFTPDKHMSLLGF